MAVFAHDDEPDEVDGVEINLLRGWVLTQLYNFSGHPTESIPGGFADGLPAGVEIAER